MIRLLGGTRLALDLGDAASHSVAGVHGLCLLCWAKKVGTLVLGTGMPAQAAGPWGQTESAAAGSRGCVDGGTRNDCCLDLGWDSGVLSDVSYSVSDDGGWRENNEGVCGPLTPSASMWREGRAGCWFGELAADWPFLHRALG